MRGIMKHTVVPFAVLFLVISLSVGDARLVQLWNYSDLVEKSTLIIIATHEKSADTKDEREFGVSKSVGVDSTFKILSVLKGKIEGEKVIVRHYKYDKSVTAITNGCRFISFPEDDKTTYLIFLKQDEGKNIVPVTGQNDPVDSFKVISNVKEAPISIH
jgi:hypothetical protein